MAPLTEFVLKIREETGHGANIPFFDPFDGGISAQCLFLLEAPGQRAVSSGFISRNNPDESAKNFFELNLVAGIPRSITAIWNIVPWYIGSGKKIRAANSQDIQGGLVYLHRVIHLLPQLRVVVIMGQKAAFAEGHLRSMRADLEILRSAHPSPLFVNNRPGNSDRILSVLKAAALKLPR